MTGSRWSLLVVPIVYAVVFELVRIGTVEPTVDAVNLGTFSAGPMSSPSTTSFDA